MQKLPAFHPVLRRFLAASALCCVLDAAALEVLAGYGLQVHIARILSLALATAALLAAGKKFVLEKGKEIKTAKGQPVPFAVLAAAGAILNFAIFARMLPLMPAPLDSFGRLFALGFAWALSTGCNFTLMHSLLPAGKKGKHVPLMPPRILARVIIWGLFVLLAFASSSVIAQLRDINAFPDIKLPLDPANPDAWLRLVQVRDWLSGAKFFDHAVRHTNAPFGGISIHWTRPMDMLVSFFYFLTPSHLPLNIRLMLAATWLPACLSLVTVALLGIAAGRHFKHVHGLGCIAILLLVSVYKYTTPGDVDHHGLLTVLWCGVLALLLDPKLSVGKTFLMGAALGLMDWISVEGLVLTAAVYALLGVEALFKPEKTRLLFFTAIGAAIVATLGMYVEIPAAEVLTRHTYDSLSIVHVALLWLTAAGAGMMAVLFRLRIPFGARFFLAAAAGAGVLAAEYLLYPKFFLGPLVDVDPFIFSGFLAKVRETQPIFAVAYGLVIRVLMTPVLAAFVICAALLQENTRPETRRFIIFLCALMGVTGALTFFELRWGYYMQPVAMTAIAALLPGMATAARGKTGVWLKDVPRGLRTYIALGCFYLAISLLVKAPQPVTEQSTCPLQLRYAVQSQQLQKLIGDKDLVLYAPQDQGGEIQFFTPYRIIASNYHREGAGLHDLTRIEEAKTADDAKPVLKSRQVGAMLLCPNTYPKESWLHALQDDTLPPWLSPVGGLKFIDIPGAKPVLLKVKK